MAGNSLRLRNDRMTWRRVEDALVVLDLHNSTYLSVNGTGALIWDELHRGCEIDALVELVVSQFDVDAATARIDIERFTAELHRRSLLE
jgi:hypothetical protein